MIRIYPFLIAFILVFVSELGDKTQLLVLSFSSKVKASNILIGVALGSFFSHGIAILFGSLLGNINNLLFQNILKIITYSSFILFGLITFFHKESSQGNHSKTNPPKTEFAYIILIASSILVGELGDKTFLSSIGLGIEYCNYKILLILGAVLGMIASDTIALLFGKFLNNKLPPKLVTNFSGFLFLLFGILGFLNFV